MDQALMEKIAAIHEIAARIARCDYKVVVACYATTLGPDTNFVICVGEEAWSRCVQIKAGTELKIPVVQLLVDDGRSLSRMTWTRMSVEEEVSLDKFARGYGSVESYLKPENHLNERLAAEY